MSESEESSSTSFTECESSTNNEKNYKRQLINSLWTQTRLVASVLDQVGIPYHRVLHATSLDMFLRLINTDIAVCYNSSDLSSEHVEQLNQDLLRIYSSIISSMDKIVTHSVEEEKKLKNEASLKERLLFSTPSLHTSAQLRFNRVIGPVLEQKLLNKVDT
ncbi:hypothetical protein [Flocculibacter collagenilyticus]|uniref:hypothetical protein n=1 Tax=Flocculibacter collagenilyticus TaxID=2744479 RepID=UPI0018F4924D|nr:hypothetical protein [Flocculibacter collagenilyticus]